jgi:hypothetical protein
MGGVAKLRLTCKGKLTMAWYEIYGLKPEQMLVINWIVGLTVLLLIGLFVLTRRGMVGLVPAFVGGLGLVMLVAQGITGWIGLTNIRAVRNLSCADDFVKPDWAREIQNDVRDATRASERAETAATDASQQARRAADRY